jgi:hypothetical protein
MYYIIASDIGIENFIKRCNTLLKRDMFLLVLCLRFK